MKRTLLFSLLICLSLTACSTLSVSKHEQDLRKELLTDHQLTQSYTIENAYWKALNMPELNHLIDELHSRNIALQKAYVGMELSQLQSELSILDFFIPHTDGAISYSQSGVLTENKEYQTESGKYHASAGLAYEASLLRKINSAHQNNLGTKATQEDIRALKISLENRLIQEYINWSINQATQAHINEQLASYTQLQENLNLTYRYGKISGLDYEKSKLQLMQIKKQKNDLDKEQYVIESKIRNLLNYKPQDTFILTAHSIEAFEELPTPDLNIPLSVLIYRPDVKASLLRLDKKWSELNRQYLNWLPKISLRSGIASSGLNLGHVFSLPLGMTQTIGLDLPFLNWPQLMIQNKQTQLLVKKEALEFEETLVTALNEVAFLYKELEGVDENISFLKQRYLQAKRIKDLQTWQYKQGRTSLEQYISSIQVFTTEEQHYFQAMLNIAKTKLALYQAMGGYITPKKTQ